MNVGEKLHIGRRVARRAGLFTRRVATAPFATLATLRAKVPERLLIAPDMGYIEAGFDEAKYGAADYLQHLCGVR